MVDTVKVSVVMDLTEVKMEKELVSGNLVICKICDKEMKKMTTAHVTTHGFKTLDDYENSVKVIPFEAELIEDLVSTENIPTIDEKITMTYDERKEFLFVDKEKDPERPLSIFLVEHGVTEDELVGMIHKYKSGRELNVKEQITKNVEKGKEEADKYKDKDKVEVFDVNISESLEKYHNFTCVSVKSKPRKTWVLIKNK